MTIVVCRVQHIPGSLAERQCPVHGQRTTKARSVVPAATAAPALPPGSPATSGAASLRDWAIEMMQIDPKEFDEHFLPEKIHDQAGRIYSYLREHGCEPDSVSREALFAYAAEALGIDYGEFDDRFMRRTQPSGR